VLRQRIISGQRVVVIGAGFIGLEFAATARAKGLEVDVIELGPRVMARAVTAEISAFFQDRHAAAGIRIHFGVQATSIEGDGVNVTGVSLSDGRHVPADMVVVGVGVLPNVELAAEASLPVASGIVVNEQLLTSDPDISAIGDCALFASPRFGAPLRLESVQNAADHARCVAARLTGDANVLIFPDLNSGNIGYKLLWRLGGAEVIGPVLMGMAKPVNVLQQGASVLDVVNLAAMTAVRAQGELTY